MTGTGWGCVALVVLAGCAGGQGPEAGPALRPQVFAAPRVGDTPAQVAAVNGVPQARERVGDEDAWIYARVAPAVPGLRSTTAVVRFRGGAVVRVDMTGGFRAPQPTFPAVSGAGQSGQAVGVDCGT